MAFELWISSYSKTRKKGTTFRELQSLFVNNITTKYIYESLHSCRLKDNSTEVKECLKLHGFDIVGIIDKNQKLIGYARETELCEGLIENHFLPIDQNLIISDSTPISELFKVLSINYFAFVLCKKENGIITRADINKPIVRIYIFGLISLFELHLNYWIKYYYTDESWKDILPPSNLKKAIYDHTRRVGKNDDLSLFDCLYLFDKVIILKSNNHLLKLFKITEIEFDNFMKHVDKIRKKITHCQDSIMSGMKWNDFINTLFKIEYFLNESDRIIDIQIQELN